MKVLSFNVKGLGKKGKRRRIREMLSKHKIDVCCFQETKMEKMIDDICKSILGDDRLDWACKDSEGSA
ncbi:hypothetical protein ACS0TY_012121 [Phlomoides rotata]